MKRDAGQELADLVDLLMLRGVHVTWRARLEGPVPGRWAVAATTLILSASAGVEAQKCACREVLAETEVSA